MTELPTWHSAPKVKGRNTHNNLFLGTIGFRTESGMSKKITLLSHKFTSKITKIFFFYKVNNLKRRKSYFPLI